MGESDARGAEPTDSFVDQLDKLICDAQDKGKRADRRANWWQSIHVSLGLSSTVLAALAGAAGLATTAGRVPAAILALISAGLAAANSFLRSDERFERNLSRRNAWQALERDIRLEEAKVANHTRAQYRLLRNGNQRWVAINNFEHKPIPPDVLGDLAPDVPSNLSPPTWWRAWPASLKPRTDGRPPRSAAQPVGYGPWMRTSRLAR
jgi:hypothetical protein